MCLRTKLGNEQRNCRNEGNPKLKFSAQSFQREVCSEGSRTR
jgi:hypothetical protein